MFGEDPAAVLTDLNTAMLLHQERQEPRFCTVVYAELTGGNERQARLTLASGGHPPCFVIRSNDAVTPVHRTGPLIGVLDDAAYTSVTVALEPGDAVLFYTDGIIEARSGGAQFGEEGLSELLDRWRPARSSPACVRLSIASSHPHAMTPPSSPSAFPADWPSGAAVGQHHHGESRVSDADRETVARQLATAVATGWITSGDLNHRLARLHDVRTYNELERLVKDVLRGARGSRASGA